MTNAEITKKNTVFIILLLPLIFFVFLMLSSCERIGLAEAEADLDSKKDIENELIFFNYDNIKIEGTSGIGIRIRNCNIELDSFGNLIILGEIENTSSSNKTNIFLTFNFYNKKQEVMLSEVVSPGVNFLRPSTKLPFSHVFQYNDKFIDLNKVKIGADYKDYFKNIEGNAIARQEKFFYEDEKLKAQGSVSNIGETKIINLVLLATFYNQKDEVVFLKKCFLPEDEMNAREQQVFTMEVLLDKYTPDFTHYDFEVFFEDTAKLP